MGIRVLAQQTHRDCQTSQHSSVLAKEGRFEGSGAPKSQTLIVPPLHADTIFVPSGENATELIRLLWAFVFSLSSPSAPARQASMRQFWPRRRDFEGFRCAPESQTLIVQSSDPDTILVPSGENATELMSPLWAFFFSLNSSIVTVPGKPAHIRFG